VSLIPLHPPLRNACTSPSQGAHHEDTFVLSLTDAKFTRHCEIHSKVRDPTDLEYARLNVAVAWE